MGGWVGVGVGGWEGGGGEKTGSRTTTQSFGPPTFQDVFGTGPGASDSSVLRTSLPLSKRVARKDGKYWAPKDVVSRIARESGCLRSTLKDTSAEINLKVAHRVSCALHRTNARAILRRALEVSSEQPLPAHGLVALRLPWLPLPCFVLGSPGSRGSFCCCFESFFFFALFHFCLSWLCCVVLFGSVLSSRPDLFSHRSIL